MSRPCDTGICDPDNCYDVMCKSDIESVPDRKIIESAIIKDSGTAAELYFADGTLSHEYSVKSDINKLTKCECVRLHIRDCGVKSENIRIQS